MIDCKNEMKFLAFNFLTCKFSYLQMNTRSKRRRISVKNDAIATTSNDAQEIPPPPPYMKLIADCWEHIFDNLSLANVLALGQTCKHMCQTVGNYVHESGT